MKVYFKKTGGVLKVTEERDGRPYCNTEVYRKNLSQLNVEEREEYNDFLRQEVMDNELIDASCMLCGASMGKMAAKDTMNTILNGAKLPKIEVLKKSRRELAGQKKELYAEYREAQRQMREAVAIKANIDHLLGITDERENKAQER